jgi:hypothetical protein
LYKRPRGAGKDQFSFLKSSLQSVDELAAEHAAERLHRQEEEGAVGMDPMLLIGRNPLFHIRRDIPTALNMATMFSGWFRAFLNALYGPRRILLPAAAVFASASALLPFSPTYWVG